jgi:ABC-type sugar transport system ATPase subunit
MTATREPLLRVLHISKTFPGLRALDDVCLDVAGGEIVAVVGQNGSGKSTLVKILAGVHEADPNGRFSARGPAGEELQGPAARAVMHFIHQDLGLIPLLSTVENLDLDRPLGARGLLPFRSREEGRRAEQLLTEFGLRIDVHAPVASLTAGERTTIAIARALAGWQRPDNVLVLDEPTAALHGDEVRRLFAAIRRVAARGGGVIFISHRLDEVMELADRVVALRDGRVVADAPIDELDHDRLVRLIAGRELAQGQIERDAALGDPVLSVRGLDAPGITDLHVDLRAGEIVGVTGILGSGREQLCSSVFGAVAPLAGEVRVGDQRLRPGVPRCAVDADVAFVPADRHTAGAVMSMSVRENLTLPRLRPLQRTLGAVDGRAERRETSSWIARVALDPADPERRLDLFSGGNQQKVVLAKWLRNRPKVLLLDEPTQGVDVGAKAAIYDLIASAAADGAGVLVSSSDTAELVRLCDRVLVLRDSTVIAEVGRDELDEERLVRESLGLSVRGAQEQVD